jgi:phospholipid-binding lipoprotein MlaA
MEYDVENRKSQSVFARLGLTAMCCLLLTACAGAQGPKASDATKASVAAADDASDVYDPLESLNRGTFAINDIMDRIVMRPIAKGYRAVVPKPVRTGVRNFLRNLKSPVNAANQLLQGDVHGFATDVSRAAINTTIGIGGLIDVAKDTGLPYEQEDFGQTLAVWGVDSGPYLVLPILGPSNFRDTVGFAVDVYADPLRIYLDNTDQEAWNWVRAGATAVDRREELLDTLDDLRKNSLDYYAALRSAYVQRRNALIHDEDPDKSQSVAIPDYDDDSVDEGAKR